MKRIAKLIKQTANKFSRLYKIYILKDEFTIQLKKWFADGGDHNLRLDYPELTSASTVFDLGGYLGDFTAAIVKSMIVRLIYLSLIQNTSPNV